MKNKCLLLLCCIFLFFCAFSKNEYQLNGFVPEIKNGKAILYKVAPDLLYSNISIQDTVVINNYHFILSGVIQHPCQVRLLLVNDTKQFFSDLFFIDTGKQNIIIDALKHDNIYDRKMTGCVVKMEHSAANDEYVNVFQPRFTSIFLDIDQYFNKKLECSNVQSTDLRNTCIEELNVQKEKLINTRDSIFYDYVIHHRNSDINIWYLLYLIRNTGYNLYYEKAFNNISDLLSKDLKYYFENLISIEKQKVVSVTFPLLDYLQLNTSKDLFLRSKYILVDFWFSSCSPCLGQFNSLKNIYKNYSNKNFEIVAISTDSKDNIKDYKELLKANKYQWKQVLDTGGVMAESISVHAYPANFLLDEKGKIIAKDISPEELEKFLEEKLN